MPETQGRIEQELTLQLGLGVCFQVVKGRSAPEVGEVYARARELCRQMGETAHLFTVLAGIHAFYVIRAELDTALEVAQQLLSIAQGRQDAALLIRAHIAMGESLIYRGEFVGARTHFARANSLYDPIQHRWLAAILGGFDFGAHSLTYVGAILWYLGYPDQAVDRLERALALARKVSNPFSISLALYYMSRIQVSRGEGEAALKAADALVLLATEEGLQQWIVYGRFALALGRLADQGQAEAGIGQLREGLASMRPSGARVGRTVFCTAIAEGCGILGRVEDGLAAVTEALAAADENEERFYEAEIHRFKGELLLKQSNSNTTEAQNCFERAIEIARNQSAKSWELRATMSLARLLDQQGSRDTARTMLAKIYNWFTEGFDTADLKEAKALLEELSIV